MAVAKPSLIGMYVSGIHSFPVCFGIKISIGLHIADQSSINTFVAVCGCV